MPREDYRLFTTAILAFNSVALVASLMHPHIDYGILVTGVAISQHAIYLFDSTYYLLLH